MRKVYLKAVWKGREIRIAKVILKKKELNGRNQSVQSKQLLYNSYSNWNTMGTGRGTNT